MAQNTTSLIFNIIRMITFIIMLLKTKETGLHGAYPVPMSEFNALFKLSYYKMRFKIEFGVGLRDFIKSVL